LTTSSNRFKGARCTAISVHSDQRSQQPAFPATSVHSNQHPPNNIHSAQRPPLQRAAIASSSTTPPSFHQRHRLHVRDANVTFINTTITLTASSNRFELNDSSVFSSTTSTSHEHVKGWRIYLRDSRRKDEPYGPTQLHRVTIPPPQPLFPRSRESYSSNFCQYTLRLYAFATNLERGVGA
jgi:hypothetical protein